MNGSVHTYVQGVHRHHLFHPSFLELFVHVCGFPSPGAFVCNVWHWCVQYGTFVYYMYYTPALRNQGVGWGLEWMIQIARTHTRLYIQCYIQLSTHHAPIYSRYKYTPDASDHQLLCYASHPDTTTTIIQCIHFDSTLFLSRFPPRTGTHYAHQSSRRTLRSLNLLVLSISISSVSLRAALTSPPASLSSMRLPSQSIPVQSRPSNAVASSGRLIIFYIICCFPPLPTRSRSNQMLLLFSIPQRGTSRAPRCSAQAGRVRDHTAGLPPRAGTGLQNH